MANQLPTTAPTAGDKAYGKIHKTTNNDPKMGAVWVYNRVLVKDEDGELETLLLTDHELGVIRARVQKNPEEHLEPTWLDKLRSL